MSAYVEIIQPGFFTTVQDNGRKGYAHLGVPESGPVDRNAYRLANTLLNNDENAAMLECTLVGPTVVCKVDTYMIITGAPTMASVAGKKIANNKPTFVSSGQRVTIGKISEGCRSYLSIAGGINTKTVLGSKSWLIPVTREQNLRKGMLLPLGISHYGAVKGAYLKTTNHYPITSIPHLLTRKGPEYHWLSTTQRDLLRNTIFTISPLWNRMAIQLNELIANNLDSLLTSPVMPGVVQLTPSGKLIVLLNDCQTTGGYPRILVVTKEYLSKLAQMQQNDSFTLTIA